MVLREFRRELCSFSGLRATAPGAASSTENQDASESSASVRVVKGPHDLQRACITAMYRRHLPPGDRVQLCVRHGGAGVICGGNESGCRTQRAAPRPGTRCGA